MAEAQLRQEVQDLTRDLTEARAQAGDANEQALRRQQAAIRAGMSITVKPFAGTDTENWTQFERLLRSSINLSGITPENSAGYLHLHLTGGALAFFDRLAEDDRTGYDRAIERLRERYANDNRAEIHRATFQSRKLKSESESIEDYLTELRRLADRAFPGENRADEREIRVKDAFILGMPLTLRRSLMNAPPQTTIQNLCDSAIRRMNTDKACPRDEYVSAFNAVQQGPSNQDALINIVSDIRKGQDKMHQQLFNNSSSIAALQQQVNHTQARIHQALPQQQPVPPMAAQIQQPFQQMQPRVYTPEFVGPLTQQSQRYQQPQQGNNNYRQQGEGQRYQNQERSGNVICKQCGKRGHLQRDCRYRVPPQYNQNLPYQNQPKN